MSRDPDDRWLLWRTGIKIIFLLIGLSLFVSAWGFRSDGAGFLGLSVLSTTFVRPAIGIILLGIGARGVQEDVRAVIERFRAQR